MRFAFTGRATRNFLTLVVVMHFILFVDRVNLAAAASVMQQDLGLSNIAPNYAGSSSALMNAARAVAGILSPVAFGWLFDRTGSWATPFAISVGLLLFAIVMTWRIRPDRPIDTVPMVAGLVVAGEWTQA